MMFEILHDLSDDELLHATHRLGLRLNARSPYADAAFHRTIAEQSAADGETDARVWNAIARVLEEIESAEGKPVHQLTDAQIDPYFRRIYAIQKQRRKPVSGARAERARRTLEEMRRDYADVGRRKIA